MVQRDDIESLLSTGSWRTSRSKSPNPYGYYSQRRPYEPSKANVGVARAADPASRTKRPPPPCVEDEEASLAKEYIGSAVSVVSTVADEEPKNRGEIDQQPILLPVHEYNPERRFVIVSNAGTDDEAKTTEVRYNANTCRKYVLVHGDKAAEVTEPAKGNKQRPDPSKEKPDRTEPKDEVPNERRDIPKRKSHQDLPRLTTDFDEPGSSIRRSNSRRDRDKPFVHQETHPSSPPHDKASARPHESAFLSPTAVMYPAGKRDRAYSDAMSDTSGRSGRSPVRRDADVEVADRRRAHHSSRYPESPDGHRRPASTTHAPSRDGPPAHRHKALVQPLGHGDPDEIFAFMAPGDDFMTGKPGRGISPPRRSRNNDSPPPHPRGAREMPNPSPNRRRYTRPPTRDRNEYSSDEEYKPRRPKGADRPYPPRSAMDPEYPTIPSPESARRSNPALAAAAAVPAMVAAHAALFPDDAQSSPRGVALPPEKSRRADEHSLSSSPTNSASPTKRLLQDGKNGAPRPHSRDANVGGASNVSASVPPPMSSSLPRSSTLDKPVPRTVATIARRDSAEPKSPTPYWHRRGSRGDRDDDDDTSLALARLPNCRWKSPALARQRGANDQFLTLKRAENFRICPDCFTSLFANTEFQHQFVPAPARPGDQPTTCDFGASPWYRIAFLMTLKHGYPDLRLLQGIASVAARSQPCAGSRLASRIWYSLAAPGSRRPIQTFSVCYSCAKMVEVLLPNLAGIFVPLDSHDPTRGICELHFAPDRKRFFDYFEEMKATSDQALTRRTAPNVTELVDRIRDISLREECLRNTPIEGRKWHVMEKVPEFTVCQECFDAVVWPMIEDDDNPSEVPRNFYKYRQPKAIASCQLYSDRMRQVFYRACKYDDFDYLASCVLERQRELAEIRARYNELQREDQDDPRVQADLAALARRFREVE